MEKSRERKSSGLFIIEGQKEIQMAVKAGYEISTLVRCPDLMPTPGLFSNFAELLVSAEIFSKLAMREHSGGLLAVAKMRRHELIDLQIHENALIIVLEAVEKPGNLGAVLRTADAAGVDAVIICDTQTDLYNPNIIRSGLGSLFTVPVAISDSAAAISFLKQKGINIYCTTLEASVPYDQVDYTKPTAIVMGTESTGLSSLWTQSSDQNIIIPMFGQVDSMNVSVSAAIVTFEAVRQRRSGENFNSGVIKK